MCPPESRVHDALALIPRGCPIKTCRLFPLPLTGRGEGWGWCGWVREVERQALIPSPVWERGRGEGVRVQGEALTSALTTACALFGDGLPSPLTLSHTGEGDLSRFPCPLEY